MDAFNSPDVVKRYDEAEQHNHDAVASKCSLILTGVENVQEDEEEDVIRHLHHRNLPKIKEDFNKAGGKGLTMEQFIKVMLHHLP